jgi:GNAT superfamily N-acetyltransferase
MSLGGYEVWDERLAHITFVTRPAFRDGGLGRAVVWAAARAALDAGLIPQHRTLETNGPALAVARALGFAPYGATLALQLPRF